MKNKLLIIVAIIPIIYLLIMLPSMPDQVVVHWNAAGEADRYGSKFMYLFISLLPSIMLFFQNVYNKHSNRQNRKYEAKTISFLVIFFAALAILFIHSSSSDVLEITRLLIFLFGVMFIYLGNTFNKLKMNRTFGIRLPATLRNEQVWNRVHYIGGYMFVGIGIITILLGLFIPAASTAMVIVVMLLLASVVFLTIYSEYLDRKVY